MSYKIRKNASGGWSVVDGDLTIADYHNEREAMLGAAAPDLIRALRTIANNPGQRDWAYVDIANRAIAKAEGRS